MVNTIAVEEVRECIGCEGYVTHIKYSSSYQILAKAALEPPNYSDCDSSLECH